MHQIRFLLGLCPIPQEGAYSAPPDLLARFKGLLLRKGWKGKKGMEVEGARGKRRRKGRER